MLLISIILGEREIGMDTVNGYFYVVIIVEGVRGYPLPISPRSSTKHSAARQLVA